MKYYNTILNNMYLWHIYINPCSIRIDLGLTYTGAVEVLIKTNIFLIKFPLIFDLKLRIERIILYGTYLVNKPAIITNLHIQNILDDTLH